MARWGRVDFRKFQDLQKRIDNLLAQDFDAFAQRAARMLAARLLAKVIRRTPSDTGFLKQGWNASSEREAALRQAFGVSAGVGTTENLRNAPVTKNGDVYEITISNSVEYASFVEYGHRTRGGKGFKPGRFMLTISSLEVEQQAQKLIQRELDKLLKEAFGGN